MSDVALANPALTGSWRVRALISLMFLHTLVDTCALLIAPLWPTLNEQFQFGATGLSIAFIVQALPTSLSQAVFGAMRDKFSTKHLLWLGPLSALLLLPLVGYPSQFAVLCVILIIGGMGVGAFHPEAAVTTGKLFPEHRTRVLSVFMFVGTMGLCLGPLLSGFIVGNFGLTGLAYLMPVLLFALLFLFLFGRLNLVSEELSRESVPTKPDHSPTEEPHQEVTGKPEEAKPLYRLPYPVMLLAILTICSLRLVPNQALDKVISFHMENNGYGIARASQVQALFLASASFGMMLMAFWFRAGWEKKFMVWCPLLTAPMLWFMGQEYCPVWLFVVMLIPVGIIAWGTASAMVSYAQALFPKGAGLASALTLGGSWGVGSLIQAPITAHFQSKGTPAAACVVFVIPVVISAFLAMWLPEIGQKKPVED